MKNQFLSTRALLVAKKTFASIAFLSLIAMSVPQGAFAQEAPSDVVADTVTTTVDTVAPTGTDTVTTPTDDVTPPTDETVTPPADDVTPPADATVTPPEDTTVTPPADTTTPPDETVTDTASSSTDATTTETDAVRTAQVITEQAAVVPTCTIVSDTSTLHNDLPSVLVSPIHSLWTAVLNGASWIWGENPINPPDAVNGVTETFTKTFTLSSAPSSASIIIAADNSYTVSVNGTEIGSDSSEFNYTSGGQDTITIPVSDLHVGTNTLSVTVTNLPMGGGTMANNPAGLLYTLTVNGSDCNTPPPPPDPFTVVATKVVCDSEADLPNWGKGGHVIGATTATDYIASHPSCHLQPGWQFEWGPSTAGDAGDSFLGHADGYTTSGFTDASGTVSMQIPSEGNSEVHMREVLQEGYIPFTFGTHPDNSDDVSAEFYCKDDSLNYDNYDFIRRAAPGGTYYCVGFNAPSEPQQPATSTVKMCKVDDTESHTPLSGWTLMIKGAHVGTATVAPDGADHPVTGVPAGSYVLTASGSYVYRPNDVAASTSDAAYSLRLPSDSVYAGPYAPWVRENDFPNPNTGWLGIMLNSSFTDWGSVFHPDHVYATSTTMTSAGDMHFSILDDIYSDNSGSLSVDVDHGYSGITGEDGCTTFTDVPYGTYTSAELNQDGWTAVSGTGTVTVDQPTETFTVVNHHGVIDQPTKYKVHIFKYLWNGETASQVPNDSDAPQFPMLATYSIAGVGTNLDPGDSYVLGNGGGGTGGSDDGLKYAANTIPLSAGDTYGTHEVTGGDSVVVADQESCVAGKYYLKGYQVGSTLSEAQGAAMSSTAPNFPSIANDEYVIVLNAACPGGDDGNPEGTDTFSTTTIKAGDLAADKTDALSNIAKWFFYNDNTDLVDNSLGSFEEGPTVTGSPLSTGSAQITLDATNDRTDLATYGFSGTKLADITTLRYSAYSHSGVAGATESPYLVFNVDFDGSDTWQKRLVFVPSDNGAVPQDTWNTFDAIDGGTAMWQYSGTVWPAAAAGSPDDGVSELGTVARSWNDILADYPNIAVRTTDSFMGVRVGEPGPTGYTGNIDAFVIGIKNGADTNTTTYDFEPTKVEIQSVNHSSRGRSGSSVPTFQGQVLGASTSTVATCGPILSSFLRIGRPNPVDQVKILQAFLNGNLSLTLPVSGFFGSMTEKAVEQFQAKYFADVLTPWVPHGLPSDHSVTGYVYKTTLRKINLVACPSLDIPLPQLP